MADPDPARAQALARPRRASAYPDWSAMLEAERLQTLRVVQVRELALATGDRVPVTSEVSDEPDTRQ